jgi:uncharacterized DUF497 family protein
MSLRIDTVEIDDGNADHLTKHGVSLAEVEDVFLSQPDIRRNKRSGRAHYYAIAKGIRVNFRYRPGIARPISAWRP